MAGDSVADSLAAELAGTGIWVEALPATELSGFGLAAADSRSSDLSIAEPRALPAASARAQPPSSVPLLPG